MQAKPDNIICAGHTDCTFEKVHKIWSAEMAQLRHLFYTDRIFVMLLNILKGLLDLVDVCESRWRMLCRKNTVAAVEQVQKAIQRFF